MVAYSFQKRFAEPILAGTKRQTIRADRRRHARPGEQLQLYTGMRTKHCRLILRATCESITPVRLRLHRAFGPMTFIVGDRLLSVDEMEEFAQADGFGAEGYGVLDMTSFWFEQHGKGAEKIDFRGVLIRWCPIPPTQATMPTYRPPPCCAPSSNAKASPGNLEAANARGLQRLPARDLYPQVSIRQCPGNSAPLHTSEGFYWALVLRRSEHHQ